MNSKSNILIRSKLLSTNFIKVIAILLIIMNHTLNYSVSTEQLRIINNQYYLIFWLYQAVSLFIIVTGIHYTKSIEKMGHNGENVLSWYDKNSFLKKVARLWVPYTLVQVMWLLSYIYKKGTVGKEVFFYYISGGVGPGGYYTICMMQILIIFPILYYIIKKYKIMGIMFIVAFNILYEIMVKFELISISFDRLCCIRLFTGLTLGIIICLYYEKIEETVIPWILFILGFGLLIWYTGGGIFTAAYSIMGIFFLWSGSIYGSDCVVYCQKRR